MHFLEDFSVILKYKWRDLLARKKREECFVRMLLVFMYLKERERTEQDSQGSVILTVRTPGAPCGSPKQEAGAQLLEPSSAVYQEVDSEAEGSGQESAILIQSAGSSSAFYLLCHIVHSKEYFAISCQMSSLQLT